jgi:hypothetical protein
VSRWCSCDGYCYLAGWFPGTRDGDRKDFRITTCVLSSHRIFSGLTVDGVAIRDYASFARLADDGIVSMGAVQQESETVVHRFRLTAEDRFSGPDLDDYLSRESKYFKALAPFMRPISDPVSFKTFTTAWETYVCHLELTEWLAHMEGIGCERLTDERKNLKPLARIEDLLPDEP